MNDNACEAPQRLGDEQSPVGHPIDINPSDDLNITLELQDTKI